MKVLTCAAARRRLDGFHDRELSIADQIAVSAHLEWCDECAALAAELRSISAMVRSVAPGRAALQALSNEDAAGFNLAVVSRMKAERDASLAARVREIFEDMHVVYAGLSATVAATVCLVLMFGMMRFAADSRPDSLASVLDVMATPFECEPTSEVPDAVACRARWVERFQRANKSAEQDAVFTLDAIVSQDGGVANLSMLRMARHDASGQAEVIEELLDTVSRAQSTTEPTELSGTMVRIVERETVRASRPMSMDLILPASKPVSSRETRRAARRITV